MLSKINEAIEYINGKTQIKPETGIILGTGLGALVNECEIVNTINYEDIPHFPVSTVESHTGRLIFGYINTKPVVIMQGRFHYYEGYSMQEVTFPVRVFKFLGIQKLLISNASGGLNRNIKVSELMLLTDHLNLLPESPLRGKHYKEFGPRFPQMSEPYSQVLIEKAREIAKQHNIKLHEGCYAAVQGPALETKAEYKMVDILGADAVGMSTVPETIVAVQMGIPVCAISVITDLGFPVETETVSMESIIAAANNAQPLLTKLFSELV
ncbi:MAG: purine-nucleoside phosphorylase [Bacteroidia bacterium]